MTISPILRQQVVQRALGRCEYCHLPEHAGFALHEIDHVIAQKHNGQTVLSNLALSCILCNKHKGSDLTSIDPLTNQIERLFHPRNDQWDEHFTFQNGMILPLSATGRVTVFLLQLNRVDRVQERRLLIAANRFS